jgi:hypothetical protein
MDDYVDLLHLTYLNGKEAGLDEIQEDIDKARRKYHDVQEIQLKLDRRQQALDEVRKRVIEEKGQVISPN